jgi:hypothetical protein
VSRFAGSPEVLELLKEAQRHPSFQSIPHMEGAFVPGASLTSLTNFAINLAQRGDIELKVAALQACMPMDKGCVAVQRCLAVMATDGQLEHLQCLIMEPFVPLSAARDALVLLVQAVQTEHLAVDLLVAKLEQSSTINSELSTIGSSSPETSTINSELVHECFLYFVVYFVKNDNPAAAASCFVRLRPFLTKPSPGKGSQAVGMWLLSWPM